MATIGSISVAFETNGVDAVQKSIDAISSSLSRVSKEVDSLTGKLSALGGIDIKVSVDTAAIDAAKKSIDNLSNSSDLEITADSTEVKEAGDAVEELEKKTKKAKDESKSFDTALKSLSESSESLSKAYQAVSDAAKKVGGSGSVKEKIDATGKASELLVRSYEKLADTTGGLVRRSVDDLVESMAESAKGFGSTVGVMEFLVDSGDGVVETFNTLGATVVAAKAESLLFAAAMQATTFATSGMSEETQALVQRLSEIPVSLAASAASSALAEQYYKLAAKAVVELASSIEGTTAAFTLYHSTIGQLTPSIIKFVSAFVPAVQVLNLASGAARQTNAEFAKTITKFALTTVAISAAKGAWSGYIAGTGAAAGASAGASAAIGRLGAMMPGLAVASIAFAVASGRVAEELKHVGQNAQMLGDLSFRFGQSVQEIEKLKIAAESANVPLNAVVRAQQAFAQNVSKVKIGNLGSVQTREAKAAFDQLGISVESLRSKAPEKLFEEVASSISRVSDANERMQLVVDIFGRTGPALLPLLKNLEQVNADIGRLGGTISDIDVSRFQAVDQSFSRLRTASGALKDDLMIPFTRMQEAFNNAQAEIIGGIAPITGAVGELVADMTTPFAVVIEVVARVVNTMLRIVAAIAKIVEAVAGFSGITAVIEVAGDEFMRFWTMIESAVAAFEQFASAVEEAFRGSVEKIHEMGAAVRELIDSFASLAGFSIEETFGSGADAILGMVTALALITLATKTFSAVMQVESVKIQVALIAQRVAWLATYLVAIPLAIATAIASIAIYVATIISATATAVASAVAMHVAWLLALGPIGWIIGAVELLAAGLAALAAWGQPLMNLFASWGMPAASAADGATASVDELTGAVASFEARAAVARTGLDNIGKSRMGEISKTITDARRGFDDLNIRAAKFGTAGEEAALKASEKFSELQRKLANGGVSAEEFASQSEEIRNGLSSALDAIEAGSPEETIKKNIKAFDELNSAAKAVDATVRKIGDDVQIGDKLFPRSSEVKARAAEYAEQYKDALDDIKKKLASGGFQQELDAKKKKNQQAFDNKEISEEEYNRTKRALDGTSAQEQAALAADNAQKEFDKKEMKLKIDMSFADDIRKQLEDAFKSPGQLLEENLKKLRENIELTDEEKSQGEKLLRQQQKEKLFGKTAEEKLVERSRDIAEAKRQGIIDPARAAEEQVKARREYLSEFGVETPQTTLDQERLKKIQESSLTAAEKASARKSLQESIVGQSSFDQRKEQEDRIRAGIASGAVDATAGGEALRKMAEEFESSLGIVKTPAEQASAKIADIADKFGLAGQNLEEMRKSLAGNKEGLDQLNRAAKEVREGLLSSLGITKDPTQELEETRKKIAEAVALGPENAGITAAEGARAEANAIRKRDEALGAAPTIGQFTDEYARRRQEIENAFGKDGANDPDKYASAIKNLNDSMAPGGAGKSPVEKMREDLDKLEALRGSGQLTDEEFAKRKLAVQAEFEDAAKGAGIDGGASRQQIGAADVRSQAGVDTFFRILQGQDNPSLKAQLRIARATELMAEAEKDPDAREVVFQLSR